MAAKTYCSNLGGTWRLPSLTELQTIVDDTKSNPAIDPTAFPNTPPTWFWTSSPLAADSSAVWCVAFNLGYTDVNVFNVTDQVRCVR
jgi:hypothetical protein